MRGLLIKFACKVSVGVVLFMPARLFATDVTYTYTGVPFSTVVGNIQPGDFLSVTLTLSTALLANQSDEVVSPLSWSITNGVTADTLTSTNNTYIFEGFEFQTNASGNIVSWALGANTGANSAFTWVANTWKIFGGITTLDEYYEGSDVSFNQDSPGAWRSVPTSSTPEPSSILLVLLPGAIGLFHLLRSRRRGAPHYESVNS